MAKQKSALGRGLGAFFPESEEEKEPGGGLSSTRLYNFEERIRTAGSIANIELAFIAPNPYQPRQSFDEGSLEELTESIRQLGIIQPLTVRQTGPDRYELISGERRLRAAERAGLRAAPAYVREAGMEAMLEMAIVENVQREALNPIEIALGYRRLMDECNLTQEQVADKVAKDRSTIANFLRLLKLPPVIQAGLRDGILSTGHARALLPVEDEDLQRRLLHDIVRLNLSVREVEKRVKALLKAAAVPATSDTDARPRVQDLELKKMTDRLRTRLGTKVGISPASKGTGGRIEVEYYSDEDLERLIDLLAE